MATPGINAPTDGRVAIDDAWLANNAANPDAVIDCVTLTPRDAFANTQWFNGQQFIPGAGRGNNAHFEPRGIVVNDDAVGGATVGTVRGCLRNERPESPVNEVYVFGMLHPVRYRYIYAQGTTARGIKLHM